MRTFLRHRLLLLALLMGGQPWIAELGAQKADAARTREELVAAMRAACRTKIEDARNLEEVIADENHPRRGEPAPPRPGGELRVQIAASSIPHLNYMLSNQPELAFIWEELHAALGRRDPETLHLEPELARGWILEDVLVLRAEGAEETADPMERRRIGKVERDGGFYRVSAHRAGVPQAHIPAERVERVDHQAAVTFFLRPGIRWHDGAPFDARDVRFSWACLRNPHVDASETSIHYEPVIACEVVDPLTVTMVFSQQHYLSTEIAARMPLLPRHLYEIPGASLARQGKEINESPFNRKFVGLGPYRFELWEPGERLVLARYEDFAGERPFPDRIVYRFIANPVNAERELRAGGIDLVLGLGSRQYLDLLQDEEFGRRFVTDFYIGPHYTCIAWNLDSPMLRAKEVREAIARCVDVEDFLHRMGNGFGLQVTGHQPLSSPAYNREIAPLHKDTERARRGFYRAGWDDTNGDGFLDDGTRPWTIRFLAVTGGEFLGNWLASSLKDIGATVKIESVERGTFYERLRERRFDAVSLTWLTPLPETDMFQVWHSSCVGAGGDSTNYSGFSDPAVDSLIEEARRSLDPQRRHALWRSIQARIYREQPFLFLYRAAIRCAWSQRWRGVKLYRARPVWRLREWYLAP